MTMGLVVIPQSVDGAVVMADSMGLLLEDGGESRLPGFGKLGFLEVSRTAFVVSGYLGASLDELASARNEPAFELAVPELYRTVTNLYLTSDLSPELLADRAPSVLAAGWSDNGPQAAALPGSHGHSEWSRGVPAIYANGWWTQWLGEPRRELEVPIPSTLSEAREFAIGLARKLFACIFNPDLVSVGFPLTVATITSDGSHFEEVTQ